MNKQNCWEFMGCGREPGGAEAAEQGVCPAASDARYDGLHGGKNGGRACWIVMRTLCEGDVQRTVAEKIAMCRGCTFRQDVLSEENEGLTVSTSK